MSHHASNSVFSTRNRYYNPVSRIQSLIHNLDAELISLCKQCSVPKIASQNSQGGGPLQKTGSSQPRHGSTISGLLQATRPATTTLISVDSKRQLRNMYRSRVIDAYRNRRIFMVNGYYNTVRRCLVRRGWIEKLPPNRLAKLQAMSEDELLEHARRGNEYEAVVLSKMINNFPAFFIWQSKAAKDMYPEAKPFRNRVRRSPFLDFSTKVGLVGCAEQERWFREDGVCGMSYPRVYRLGGNSMEEREAFIDDFQQTQARCLLRYIKEHRPNDLADTVNGTILSPTIEFALNKVRKMIREKEHQSLDDARVKMPAANEIADNESFMLQSSKVLKEKAKFNVDEKVMAEYARLATQYLDQLEALCPDFCWDGYRNLWILKPGYQCRGIGIVIRSSLDDILQWTINNKNRKYIVQKYIERPHLIYRTKFDIRQYMLITITDTKVTMWTYKDCYLRFSSQEFTMDDLKESIHLTNNSVQKRYKNKPNRDPRLPKHNMWSLEQFQRYLHHVGAPQNTWANIYNGMKQNLTAVLVSSLDETKFVPNAFELYGCDFMLDEHYNPILIEVNSSPDLSHSTEVTARICPMALKDCLRVVLDVPRNPNASTGLFERVFQVDYNINKESNVGRALELNGTQMRLMESLPKAKTQPRLLRKILNVTTKAYPMIRKSRETGVKLSAASSSKAISQKISKSSSRITGGKTLNSKTKQSLALQYTAPK